MHFRGHELPRLAEGGAQEPIQVREAGMSELRVHANRSRHSPPA
jgi:hypothetical protein